MVSSLTPSKPLALVIATIIHCPHIPQLSENYIQILYKQLSPGNMWTMRYLYWPNVFCPVCFALLFTRLPIPNGVEARTHRDLASWRIQERTIEFGIEENCPLGTELGTVALATSASSAQTPALKYKFGSPSNLFTVDEHSGQLTTLAPIDAEMLCARAREQESGTALATISTVTASLKTTSELPGEFS
ncbi:uncharacterized protein DEA37_0002387 [Paragonimus westermani]|uniref:Cadherin domain-containing protein n=1 Tax=Paragonimus westermani TaxID=34504 RepID=A0A5J4NSH2_9TREM|nr:uncharacterized protein DEA37_0002387 [Paragonimus westermani]